MSFRKRHNRHDAWATFREAHREETARIGLPESIFKAEHRLVAFLSEGVVEGESVDLRQIPDEQLLRLENVVNAFLFDGWVQSEWTAWRAERLRRFGRYG